MNRVAQPVRLPRADARTGPAVNPVAQPAPLSSTPDLVGQHSVLQLSATQELGDRDCTRRLPSTPELAGEHSALRLSRAPRPGAVRP